MHLHLHTKQARLDRRGDLGRTACLRTVADHAGINGNGVNDGVRDLAVLPAVQIRHACGRAAAGRRGPAVSGQAADTGFQMDGDEV